MALAEAVRQLRKEQQRLQSQLGRVTNALHALDSLGRGRGRAANGRRKPRARHMSAAARRRIAAAQRARWTKLKAKNR
jgi:hypothetical protein